MKFATRVGRVVTSPSTLAAQRAREMKAAGADIVSLTTGEPDFPTPDHIIEAAFRAARAGQTRYTTVSGTVELKAAIIEKFRRENGLAYEAANICVGNGGKQILFNAIMATVDPGDEVEQLLRTPVDHFIGGEFVEPSGGDYFETANPASGETLARVANGSADDVEHAAPLGDELAQDVQ